MGAEMCIRDSLAVSQCTRDKILEEIKEYMKVKYISGTYTVRQLQAVDFIDEKNLPILSRFYKNSSLIKLEEKDGFVLYQKPKTTNTEYKRVAIKKIEADYNKPIYIIIKDKFRTQNIKGEKYTKKEGKVKHDTSNKLQQ